MKWNYPSKMNSIPFAAPNFGATYIANHHFGGVPPIQKSWMSYNLLMKLCTVVEFYITIKKNKKNENFEGVDVTISADLRELSKTLTWRPLEKWKPYRRWFFKNFFRSSLYPHLRNYHTRLRMYWIIFNGFIKDLLFENLRRPLRNGPQRPVKWEF